MSKENLIKFAIPIDIEKGKNAKGDEVYRFKGLASTTNSDNQGETLLAKQFILDNFKQVNWNHKGKDDPGAILGEIDKHHFDRRGLNIEGELYSEMPMTNSAVQLMKAMKKRGKQLQLSVEGQVLERGSKNKNHPDYKKILKANLTGVALTPNAVNQNTFAELIEKGESNLEWQFDAEEEALFKSAETGQLKNEDDIVECPTCHKPLIDNLCKGCGYMHKAMTAESPTIGESVEGAHKKNLKVAEEARALNSSDKKVLSKSDLYEQIFAYFCPVDINKATQVYQLAEKISTMSKEKTISQETLNKAFEIIELASKDNATKTVGGAIDLIKSDDFDDLEKSEVVAKLIEKGFPEDMAKEASDKETPKKKKKKGDDKDEKKDEKKDDSKKDEKKDEKKDDKDDDDDENDGNEMKKSIDTLRVGVEEFQSNSDIKLGAIGVILKSQNETIEALTKSNEAMTATIDAMSKNVEKIAKAPVYKNLLDKTSAIERFEKSEDGFSTFNLNNKVQRKALANKIEVLSGSPGDAKFDEGLYKAAQDIELLGVIGSAKTIKYLEEVHKIKVVKGVE